jgi:hypothetical protein
MSRDDATKLAGAERAARSELNERLARWKPVGHWADRYGEHRPLLDATRETSESFALIVRLALGAGGNEDKVRAYIKAVAEAVSCFEVSR